MAFLVRVGEFQEKRGCFIAIRDGIRKLEAERLTPELNRFEKMITELQENPTRLCDDTVCRKLGDALLAGACKQGNPAPGLVSSNFREYSALCDSLEVIFHRYGRFLLKLEQLAADARRRRLARRGSRAEEA